MRWATEVFAHIGRFFLAVYDPNSRSDRRTFLREVASLALVAFAFYWVTLPLETAEWLSDEAFAKLIPVASVLIDLWVIALMAASARRAHDMGLSGAWAFLLLVPVLHIIALLFLFIFPGRDAPTGWPDRRNREHHGTRC